MIVSRIDVEGWKNLGGSYALPVAMILTGPNGSGKSALAVAIRWAIRGDVPDGKTLDAVARYAGPLGCRVRLEIEGRPPIERSLIRDHRKNRLSQDVRCGGSTGRAAEELIEAATGKLDESWSLDEFLALSSDKRRAYVLELCGGQGETDDAGPILGDVERAFLRDKLGTVADDAGVVADLWKKLAEADRQAAQSIFAQIEGGPAASTDEAGILAWALDQVTQIANIRRREYNEAVQAVRRMSDRRAALTVTARAADDLRADLAKYENDAKRIAEQIGKQRGAEKARQSLKKTIEDRRYAADQNAGRGRPLSGQVDKLSRERADVVDRLKAARARLDELPEAAEIDADAVRDELVEAAVAWKLGRGEDPIGRLVAAVDAWIDLDAERNEAVAVAAARNEVLLEVAGLDGKLERIESCLVETRNQLEMQCAETEKIDADILDAERRLGEVESGDVPIEDLEAQAARLESHKLEIRGQLDAKLGARALDAEIAETIAAKETGEYLHEAAKSIATAIRTVRERYIGGIVAPLLADLDRFLELASPGRCSFLRLENDRGAAVFEIGWRNDSAEVPLEALSGGESTVFRAGLAAAMISAHARRRTSTLRLLAVRGAELDRVNLGRLEAALQEARLDQWMIETAIEDPIAVHGDTVLVDLAAIPAG